MLLLTDELVLCDQDMKEEKQELVIEEVKLKEKHQRYLLKHGGGR